MQAANSAGSLHRVFYRLKCKHIDASTIKLYHSPFMLNRILIDPQAFTQQSDALSGEVSIQDLDERVWSPDLLVRDTNVTYRLEGGIDRWQRPYLLLSVQGQLPLQCQRCMQTVDFVLDEQVHVVLFDDETQLDEAMLADETLEGMLLENELDVLSLVEDQLLMALPFAPRHEHCEQGDRASINMDKHNPFAMLAGLKKSD